MRWKCSLLNEEEREEINNWISELVLKKEEAAAHPWKVGQDGMDELSAENEYIQRYVLSSPTATIPGADVAFSSIDALPATVDLALEQIERATGMKAILLIGGPTPATDGDFSTHV